MVKHGRWSFLFLLLFFNSSWAIAPCADALAGLPQPAGISAGQWRIFSRQIARSKAGVLEALKKEGASLRVAGLVDLLKILKVTEAEFKAGQLRYSDQMILPADTEEDLELLMAADLDGDPRESFQVSILLNDKRRAQSDIRVGDNAAVGGELLKNSINEVLARAQKLVADHEDIPMALLVFSHTHTVPDFYFPGQNQLLPSELSPQDLELGKTISKLFAGVPVLIKAVLQNGYSYQMIFKNGEAIKI